MDAKIKEGKLQHLSSYGFQETDKSYIREIKYPVLLVVDKKTHYMVVKSPIGEVTFMESHKDKFQDLIDADLVEFVKGKLDR
ncbi:hypothetical protein EV204_105178 [Tissierella praeacuta]|uniref:hypothetical protein n=1 Tax=Tissierella praeacuta TaxID=43131 RepID=UPI0010490129|nr:hypothetical protein [Tissierella praeacuta]TCU72842.1 hypothetical protein EV204_105178 [Tissierella praeacuta]